MKAKIKALIILIAVFAVSLIAGIAAGCSIGEINAKQQADGMGYTCGVTYYANGGTFRDGTDDDGKVYRTIYYRPETPIFNIGEDKAVGKNITIYRTNYVFTGWQYCVRDEEDKPVLKDLEGNTLKVLDNGTADIKGENGIQLNEQEKRFTAVPDGNDVFADGKVLAHEGQHLYLVATWVEDVKVHFKLVTDDNTDIVVGEGENAVTYKTGDEIHSTGFGSGSTYTLRPENFKASAALGSSHSYLSLYYDVECTRLVKSGETLDKPAQGAEEPVIYARYREGSWTPVRDAAGVATMLASTGANKYFIVDDINCTGRSGISLKVGRTFYGFIDGNNCTISNITIGGDSEFTAQQLYQSNKASLFGNMGEGAGITDLTLKDVSVRAKVNSGDIHLFAVLESVDSSVVLDNFTVDGITIRINTPGSITNIPATEDGQYNLNRWLYGAYDTDAEFTEKYGTVSVRNAVLYINDKQVTGGQ